MHTFIKTGFFSHFQQPGITFFHRHEKRKFKIIIFRIPEFYKSQQRKSFQTLKVEKQMKKTGM